MTTDDIIKMIKAKREASIGMCKHFVGCAEPLARYQAQYKLYDNLLEEIKFRQDNE